MKNVMTRAWEIAKQGQKQFGGSTKEYFAAALKMAWSETRKVTIETTSGSRKHKSWVAEITGKDSSYGFSRKFIEGNENGWSNKTFDLTNGTYEVCNAGERKFIRVSNGQIENINESEVAA